jgi:hypothetical protein
MFDKNANASWYVNQLDVAVIQNLACRLLLGGVKVIPSFFNFAFEKKMLVKEGWWEPFGPLMKSWKSEKEICTKL